MDHHREHTRVDIRLSAEVRHAGRTFTATTRNLSIGGCCLESAYPFSEDKDVTLSLFVVVDDIEDARTPPLQITAQVQWCAESDAHDGHVAGVKFAALEDAQRRWIARFVRDDD